MDVTLNWSTATEINNRGFDVERKSAGGSFEKVGFISGNGTSTEINKYNFTDRNLTSGNYNYRIKQIDFDGTSKYYSLNETVKVGLPTQFSLSQNYPNPFYPGTMIKYSIPQNGFVKLYIYNSLGQKVADLVNQPMEAGNYEINFNASKLSSGVYFYKLEVGDFTAVKKLMLLK